MQQVGSGFFYLKERTPALPVFNTDSLQRRSIWQILTASVIQRTRKRLTREARNGGLYGKPEGCVMCERREGMAGTPRKHAHNRFLLRLSYQGGFFRCPDGIRQGYE